MFHGFLDQKGKFRVNLDDNVHVQSSFEGFGDPTKQLERSPALQRQLVLFNANKDAIHFLFTTRTSWYVSLSQTGP
jgi:hypothetical protein